MDRLTEMDDLNDRARRRFLVKIVLTCAVASLMVVLLVTLAYLS